MSLGVEDSGNNDSWRVQLMDDQQGPRVLEAALDLVAPIPDWVTASANRAWALRRIDAELAELIAESTSAAAGARGDGDSQVLVFETARLRLELLVRTDELGTTVDGVFDRNAAPASPGDPIATPDAPGAVIAFWEGVDGTGDSAPVDVHGGFFFEIPHRQRIRVWVESPRGWTLTITDWFHLEG